MARIAKKDILTSSHIVTRGAKLNGGKNNRCNGADAKAAHTKIVGARAMPCLQFGRDKV